MTIERRNQIAFMIMHRMIRSMANERTEDDLMRKLADDGGFMTTEGTCRSQTKVLMKLAKEIISGKTLEETTAHEQRVAYAWVRFGYSNEERSLNNSYRRHAGRLGAELDINSVYMVEFFRVMLHDIIDEAFAQTNDLTPLFIKS